MEVKAPCTYVIEAKSPVETLQKVCGLLTELNVEVEALQLMVTQPGRGKLVIHCETEKDRTAYIGRQVEDLAGVESIEWINMRTRQRRY
jgi:hypothetical protein